ncbi:hypothetical protein ABB37_03408 [Leptomonas pyrrhocoris]|uniref:Uncharacterized protein n=1 Tax=Leptomonas pyrrhocoris TaxID=157538 RepID=A0A0N0DWY3_LEPPY|nr:hypothetical protein ABB37_03408 [Leptomonas pyrrhocoris]KPA82312.1 hypothetical protein ABB37_03408 [Leptomonas pyrrhocoris]|eukprot:XP_015660751.1 hypothetical protein ABB37_03408 [Leptomonas pyrrhocoris]
MRFYVEACFNTDAPGLILSTTPGEDRAALVADNCRVELRLHTPNADTSISKNVAPVLEALPWDSSQLRLCVNGISYGTGPLMLRDRDALTLQEKASPDARTPQEYVYSITALPDVSPCASSAAEGNGNHHRSKPSHAEDQRLHVVLGNVAEYAKWNNFYSDRFGDCAVVAATPAANTSCAGFVVPLRRCSCGHYLPKDRGVAARVTSCASARNVTGVGGVSVLPAAATATETHRASRALVTLLPSIPTLLDAENEAVQRGALAPPAVAPRCAWPSVPSRTGGRGGIQVLNIRREASSVSATEEAKNDTADNGSGSHEVPVNERGDAALSSGGVSAWTAYYKAREKDWQGVDSVSTSKEPSTQDTFLKARFDRPIADLLLRVASLESALMGCRYE